MFDWDLFFPRIEKYNLRIPLFPDSHTSPLENSKITWQDDDDLWGWQNEDTDAADDEEEKNVEAEDEAMEED